MRRWRYAISATAALVVAIASLTTAWAQDATPVAVIRQPAVRFPAEIHAGTCAAPGATLFSLTAAAYGLPAAPGGTAAATPAMVVTLTVAGLAASA